MINVFGYHTTALNIASLYTIKVLVNFAQFCEV